jgi:hypothetical protein
MGIKNFLKDVFYIKDILIVVLIPVVFIPLLVEYDTPVSRPFLSEHVL